MEKKRVFKRCLSAAGYIVTALIIAAVIYVIYSRATGKVPELFGHSVLRIVTGSMEPEIPTGSYILTETVEPDELQVGDVIAFYSTDPAIYMAPNTHRIAEIKQTSAGLSFVTKGDANRVTDEYQVVQSLIIGRYVRRLPALSAIGGIINTPWIFLVIIVIPAAVFFVIEMVNVAKKAQELKDETDEGDNDDEE